VPGNRSGKPFALSKARKAPDPGPWSSGLPMVKMPASLPEVYSGREIARAAGVSRARVVPYLAPGETATIDGEYVAEREAVRLVRALRAVAPVPVTREAVPTAGPAPGDRPLFAAAESRRRPTGVPLVASSVLHATGFGVIVLLSTLGAFQPVLSRETTTATVTPVRLVFTAEPGPGGGGGGGGARQPLPPPKAKLRGTAHVSSPVPVRQPPPPVAPPKIPIEVPRPPLRAETLPPIIAPVVSVASDARDRVGVLNETPVETESRGPGSGGGVGTGTGVGVGEGDGSGIGPGSGGGVGGGPYRPGSGVEPPRILREVKPSYTEEARRAGVNGEVVLEIVVRRDGSVGDVRVLQRLGSGLDERAIDAVRQWRFDPARRQGVAVDVIVEVSVEFKLR
jgi:TonB family protein